MELWFLGIFLPFCVPRLIQRDSYTPHRAMATFSIRGVNWVKKVDRGCKWNKTRVPGGMRRRFVSPSPPKFPSRPCAQTISQSTHPSKSFVYSPFQVVNNLMNSMEESPGQQGKRSSSLFWQVLGLILFQVLDPSLYFKRSSETVNMTVTFPKQFDHSKRPPLLSQKEKLIKQSRQCKIKQFILRNASE